MLLALLLAANVIRLPAGDVTVTKPIRVTVNTTLRGHSEGTVIRAGHGFAGRAVVECSSGCTVENLTIEGNRSRMERALPIAPYDRDFIGFYANNGLIADGVEGLTVHNVTFRHIANFAAIVARSRRVVFRNVTVEDSGSRNRSGRNNTTGGILLEEGTSEFVVSSSKFRRVRGNAVWTHSRAGSPRNGPGRIEDNDFEEIGRDAVQAGHATHIEVTDNRGQRIGYPTSVVDTEGGGIPVAIDTAGNVDRSTYRGNRFQDINGKCIDLDGFHHGTVAKNHCSRMTNFAIVFNNTNPEMQSTQVVVEDNVFEDLRYGAIFVIGTSNTIRRNRMLRVNMAGCNDAPNCIYDASQPDLLRAGIYIGHAAERPAPASDNIITENVVEGRGMSRHCVVTSPKTDRARQTIEGNTCSESTAR
ncbi:MAG TPA: right-handed parallel beta-helix repeat-containing protein [Bryobacteraceae bacterium]|nr:right-handed parallel beta-helix repeat-containing protein [Bryobacteraceae bacterium]